MAIDREAALIRAEKCLRQGRLDGAIEEYVRLVDEQPGDWGQVIADTVSMLEGAEWPSR